MPISAIKNQVIFKFDQDTAQFDQSQFKEKTSWGFDLGTNFDESSSKSRWGTVVFAGPDCIEPLSAGTNIYVDALKWTNRFVVDGISYWKTDEDQILAVQL